MASIMQLPVDFDSITYSQQSLNTYFTDPSSEKKLVVIQRYGRAHLELRPLSLCEKTLAHFGCGLAGFATIMQFCADHCLSHKKLKHLIHTYNSQHSSFKRVDDTTCTLLKKACESPLLQAITQGNEPTVNIFTSAPWADIRSCFMDNLGIVFEACHPSKSNPAIVATLLEIVNKAPKSDQEIIYQTKNAAGQTIPFLLLLQVSKLTKTAQELLRPFINQQDARGKTALLELISQKEPTIADIETLLTLEPDLLIKDCAQYGVLSYLIDRQIDSVKDYDTEYRIIRTLLDSLKKLDSDAQKDLLSHFFEYKNEQGQSFLFQSLQEENFAKARFIEKIRSEFGLEPLNALSDMEQKVLSQSTYKNIFERSLNLKQGSDTSETTLEGL